MYSPSRSPLSLPSPPNLLWVFPAHQARAFVSCIQPGLVICFILDNIHVSMLFSRNIPPSPSPTESKILFCTSVSLLLFCIWGYHYHLSKFHIYALVYCNGLYLSGDGVETSAQCCPRLSLLLLSALLLFLRFQPNQSMLQWHSPHKQGLLPTGIVCQVPSCSSSIRLLLLFQWSELVFVICNYESMPKTVAISVCECTGGQMSASLLHA